MPESSITRRVEEIRREIANIRSANRVFQSNSTHNRCDINLHETRRQRLQEIVFELDSLLHRRQVYTMSRAAIAERLKTLRQECSELTAANCVYWARSVHTKPEIELQERRRKRLEEIRTAIRILGERSHI
jgi:hypothetical protein